MGVVRETDKQSEIGRGMRKKRYMLLPTSQFTVTLGFETKRQHKLNAVFVRLRTNEHEFVINIFSLDIE